MYFGPEARMRLLRDCLNAWFHTAKAFALPPRAGVRFFIDGRMILADEPSPFPEFNVDEVANAPVRVNGSHITLHLDGKQVKLPTVNPKEPSDVTFCRCGHYWHKNHEIKQCVKCKEPTK